MSRLRSLGGFFYDFVIGDDPLIVAAVVAALGLTAALEGTGVAAWWVLPGAVAGVLAWSVRRAT